jgi:hypothetical protein
VGAQSCDQICRYLSSYGWRVTVLTVRERHIEDPAAEIQPFPGVVTRTDLLPHPLFLYRRLRAGFPRKRNGEAREAELGMEPPASNGRLRRWLLSMLMLPDSYTSWIPTAVAAGLREIRRERVDCLFSSGPWWTNHIVGFCLARMTGLPWVAHFRDPWTQGPWLKPTSDWSVRIEKALERLVLRSADTVVCVTDAHASLLRRSHPDLDPGKFVSIPNGYDGTEWASPNGKPDGAQHEGGEKDRFVITYAGNLYAKRTPYPLFASLRSLIDSGEAVREHFRIELIGNCYAAGDAPVPDMAASFGLETQVDLPGFLGRKETLRRVARSNLLLLLAEDWPYRIPAKTYEYLRAGRPILALTTEEALVDLLSRTGGAWVADPTRPEEIRAALKQAYSLWKEGRDQPGPRPDLVASFDRRVLAGRLAQVLESAHLDRTKPPGRVETWRA